MVVLEPRPPGALKCCLRIRDHVCECATSAQAVIVSCFFLFLPHERVLWGAFSLFPWGHLRARPVEGAAVSWLPHSVMQVGRCTGCPAKRAGGRRLWLVLWMPQPQSRKEGGRSLNCTTARRGSQRPCSDTHPLPTEAGEREPKTSFQFCSSWLASARVPWAVLGGGPDTTGQTARSPFQRWQLAPCFLSPPPQKPS